MFIGIDAGTSAVKAVLVDDGQAELAQASVPLATMQPRPLWSEQAPDDWWLATRTALAQLRDAAPGAYASVAGIGLSGQMHGAVCLGVDQTPVRPAILWNDGRATAECDALNRELPALGTVAGIIAMPGFTAPKLRWMATHEPDSFARTRTVLLPKDYLRLQLTGELATDPSDAAGTLWLDQAAREWSPGTLDACGLTAGHMPRIVEGNAASGQLRAEVAAELGLPRGTPVAAGAGDAAAGAVGISAVDDGDAFVSLGTSGQVFVTRDRHSAAPEALVHAFAHCLPGRWFQMGCMLNGASCLAWAAQLLGTDDIDVLLARVEREAPHPGSVQFLPYLTGERTPHNDAYARGTLFGMGPETGPADIVRAVLEGVAFSVRDCADALRAAGTKLNGLAAIGGGSRSTLWMQVLADVLDLPVHTLPGSDRGPAFGAARLAMMASGGATLADACPPPDAARTFIADADATDAYAPRYAQFKRLYRALRHEYAERHRYAS